MPGTAAENEGGTDSTPNLTDFQLEIARLFFSLPASKGFLLAGEPPCSRSTSRRGPRKTSISSLLQSPPSLTAAGPTLDPEELAGHKLLALYDRAAARDFVDVYLLAQRFGQDVLLARAAQMDMGLYTKVLADMIATLGRFTDDEIPVPGGLPVSQVRAFYATWRSELITRDSGSMRFQTGRTR